MSDVPSPAGKTAQPEHNGLAKMPWESALYEAVRALEHRAREAERERDEMALVNHKLRRDLALSRERLENWKLRQAAWRRERDELLRRIQ